MRLGSILVALLVAGEAVAAEGTTGDRPTGAASRSEHVGTLSDSAELDRVVELYLAGQYEHCTEGLEPLLTPAQPGAFSDPQVIERGRLYFASCALLSGKAGPARDALRAALESNPLMAAPDSLTFPPPVLALFLEVREEVQSLIAKKEQEQVARLMRENEEARRREAERAQREVALRRLAEEEVVVAKSSRVVASLPFGAGQFQNGDETLGNVFLIGEGVLAAGAFVSTAILLDEYSNANNFNRDGSIKESSRSAIQVPYVIMGATTIALLSSMALGILQAHVAYQPERRIGVRTRPLPPELRESSTGVEVRPYGFGNSEGAQFGVVGRF
jgi:hypothetical protein